MGLLLIGLGGAAGSLCRFLLGRLISSRSDSLFPWGTFWINLSGAALLGLVSGLGEGGNSYLLLAEGFLGAYTTFSTFMYEDLSLLQSREKKLALIYLAGSLLLGITAFLGGLAAGNYLKTF